MKIKDIKVINVTFYTKYTCIHYKYLDRSNKKYQLLYQMYIKNMYFYQNKCIQRRKVKKYDEIGRFMGGHAHTFY